MKEKVKGLLYLSFSILKRIVMGETRQHLIPNDLALPSFSILKRIVMGETLTPTPTPEFDFDLSVSSSGS